VWEKKNRGEESTKERGAKEILFNQKISDNKTGEDEGEF